MNRIGTLGAIIAIAATASGCGGESNKAGGEQSAETVVLTLANPDDSPFDLDEYAREVANESGGSLRIEFENTWRTGDPDNEIGTIEDVRAGKVDMGSVGARVFDLVGVNTLQPLLAPFAIDSYALEREVLDSSLAAEMLTGVEAAGVVPITLLPGALRRPLGVSRPLVEASDYRGATIGIRPSELGARTFAALGAETVGYHFSDDVTAFDGIETQVIDVAFTDDDVPARTFAPNVSLWPRVLTIVMNTDAYDALSDAQREALSAAGDAALDPSLADIQGREEEAVGILCSRGELAVRSATPPQLASLHAATARVTQALERDPASREALVQIATMRAKVEPEPAPACASQEAQPTPGGGTPVDGVWRMETTEDEAAALVPRADLVPENWGEFTYVFGAGRFAFTTESEGACIWAYGSFTVDGDTVEWRIEDGGGETPNDAANQPGEVFTYGWSRFRDQLTLTALEGEISPEPFRVEPWRRLEGEVSLEPLSDRCPPPADALEP